MFTAGITGKLRINVKGDGDRPLIFWAYDPEQMTYVKYLSIEVATENVVCTFWLCATILFYITYTCECSLRIPQKFPFWNGNNYVLLCLIQYTVKVVCNSMSFYAMQCS